MKPMKLFVVLSCIGLSACGAPESPPEPVPELPAQPLESEHGEDAVSLPSLAFGREGQLAISWAGTRDLHVRRWAGTRWESLGDALSEFAGTTRASWSSVQVDAQGNPVVAWTEELPGEMLRKSIVVRRWDGGRWLAVGTALNMSPQSYDASGPLLRLDAEGHPLVAWSEQNVDPRDTEGQLAVRRWTGSAWQSLGAPALGPGRAAGMTMVGGAPVLVSQRLLRLNDNLIITVWRWTGSTWETLGDSLGERAIAPQVGADAAGNLFLVWLEEGAYPNPTRLQAARWSGSEWEPLPGLAVASSTGALGIPSLAFDAEGRPLVAWIQAEATQSLRLARWNGTAWDVKVAEESTVPGSSDGGCALGFHPTQGAVVAWTPHPTAKLRVLKVAP